MKPYRWLFLLLLSALMFAQAAPTTPQAAPAQPPQTGKPAPAPTAPATKPPESAATAVLSTAPVITLKGICTSKPGMPKPADCKTVVTRDQFERMVSALTGQPTAQLPPQVKQQAANKIAEVMIVSHEAEKRGVQNKPEMQEILRYIRMNALAQELVRTMQSQYAHSSPQEVQQYYNANKAQFEEAKLKRIFIPKPRPADNKPVDEAAFKASAEKIRAEAAANGDFDKLQKQAFEAIGVTTPPPPTDMGTMRLVNVPHKQVADLKAGEVSQLIPDTGGFYIYKLESRQIAPLDKVSSEIEKTLGQQKFENAAKQISDSAKTELNPAYFGPSAAGAPGSASSTPSKPAGTSPRPAAEGKPPAPPKK